MPIKIIHIQFPVDNSGRMEGSEDSNIIMETLKEQDSDDDLFTDVYGNTYSLDDLMGREIIVGGVQFVLEPK